MRKFSHEELIARQARKPREPLPFSVILNDIRSLYNVGSIFRTADGAGLEKIWICGITGFPPASQITKTALGAEDAVPWEYRRDPCSLIRQLKEDGAQIVLLEQAPHSIPYETFEPRGPVCLVVGNEIFGVSDELVSLCDAAVEIEMAGTKNSLNVSVAFGVVAYHFRNTLRKAAVSSKGA
ncbi:MAG TPA: RNA methyltransferase [Verrucomicrobiae bacterium]|jgi:tRNA G18 (ribose-2'-O)-methylase SpoU|nr:RNA methyltransferase [Verrucomicrobiae bacterium]